MDMHISPAMHSASFFDEKRHSDQNEKMNMYGVIHVLAIDKCHTGWLSQTLSGALFPKVRTSNVKCPDCWPVCFVCFLPVPLSWLLTLRCACAEGLLVLFACHAFVL